MESNTAPRPLARFRQRCGSLLRNAVVRRHWQRWSVFALLLFTLLTGPNGAFNAMATLFPPSQPQPSAAAALTPMTQDQALANQAQAWGHASGTQQTLAQLLATGPHTEPDGAIIPRQVVTLHNH